MAWLNVKRAAEYSSASVRTLRDWIRNEDLRFSKVRGLILIHTDDLDTFIRGFEKSRGVDMGKMIDEVLEDMNV